MSYLSEDEAGGGGAAVGPFQPATSGVRPSVSLRTKHTHTNKILLFIFCICDSVVAVSYTYI